MSTDSCRRASASTPPSNSAEAHKNEGFLKSAWHRLTNQHDNLVDNQPSTEEKKPEKDEEEAKRASGSG